MRMVRWAIGNEEILEEARMEPRAMVMRRPAWFERAKRRHETENIGLRIFKLYISNAKIVASLVLKR